MRRGSALQLIPLQESGFCIRETKVNDEQQMAFPPHIKRVLIMKAVGALSTIIRQRKNTEVRKCEWASSFARPVEQ